MKYYNIEDLLAEDNTSVSFMTLWMDKVANLDFLGICESEINEDFKIDVHEQMKLAKDIILTPEKWIKETNGISIKLFEKNIWTTEILTAKIACDINPMFIYYLLKKERVRIKQGVYNDIRGNADTIWDMLYGKIVTDFDSALDKIFRTPK